MKRVIYTAIIGAYDAPPRLAPEAIDAHCDYLCFCDVDIDLPPPWQLRRIERMPAGAAATNRRVKFRVHELISGYEQACYMDGNVDLLRFPDEAFAALEQAGCVLLAHPQRRSVRAEMVACVLTGKLRFREALALAAAQSGAGFDDILGMTANRLFARRLTDTRVNALFEAVFDDYLAGPPRDQLHLPHALQRLGVLHVVLPRQWALDTFTLRPHSGVDLARGRLARALCKLLLGPPLSALLAVVAYFNHKETSRHD